MELKFSLLIKLSSIVLKPYLLSVKNGFPPEIIKKVMPRIK
jgi:hypothetical protein